MIRMRTGVNEGGIYVWSMQKMQAKEKSEYWWHG